MANDGTGPNAEGAKVIGEAFRAAILHKWVR